MTTDSTPTPAEPLKPCPFCGETPRVTERPDNIDGTEFFAAVACYCGGYSATAHKMERAKTQAEATTKATAAWNRRATPPAAVEIAWQHMDCVRQFLEDTVRTNSKDSDDWAEDVEHAINMLARPALATPAAAAETASTALIQHPSDFHGAALWLARLVQQHPDFEDGGFFYERAQAVIDAAEIAQPAAPEPLTDDQIDRIADNVVKAMPDGISGFAKGWGWRQFARELLDVCAGHSRATQAQPATHAEVLTDEAVDRLVRLAQGAAANEMDRLYKGNPWAEFRAALSTARCEASQHIQAEVLTDEWEAFEASATVRQYVGDFARDRDGDYANVAAAFAWHVWQAAIATKAAQQPKDVPTSEALDPAISECAQALIERGQASAPQVVEPLTEKFGYIRHYLHETARFASLAPRARENINTALELLGELEASFSPKKEG